MKPLNKILLIIISVLSSSLAEKNVLARRQIEQETMGVIKPGKIPSIDFDFDSDFDLDLNEYQESRFGYLDLSSLGSFTDLDAIDVQLLEGRSSIKFQKKDIPNKHRESWHGEAGNATINLLRTEVDGQERIFGTVVEGDEIFQIAPDESGIIEIVTGKSVDEYPPEADPIEFEYNSDEEFQIQADLDKSEHSTTSGKGSIRGRDLANDFVEIDIMVVWTKNAECAYSRQSSDCMLTSGTENNMRGLVALAVQETNAAFSLSGIELQLNLVHDYRHPYYKEYGEQVFPNALNDATYKLDDVKHNREKYGADLVSMIIDESKYCGLGWIGPIKERGVSISAWDCATGYFSFGHEIAHNLGCNHDRGTKRQCNNGNINYGYRDPNAAFRSIMAYNCRGGQCDGNRGGGCPRVQRFSNTYSNFAGRAIGDSSNDNAKHINRVKATVASWYPTGGTGGTALSANTAPPTELSINSSSGLCAEGHGMFQMILKLDKSPKDISWELKTAQSRKIMLSGGGYETKNEELTFEECIPNSQYVFVMLDSKKNGLCCKKGNGHVKIKWNGKMVKEAAEFEDEISVTFGTQPTSNPSAMPSSSLAPTVLPTDFPSVESSWQPTQSRSPTISPTLSPTIPLTEIPSFEPSGKPSQRPTVVLTPSPTSKTSESPTLLPTSAPFLDSNNNRTYAPTPPPKLVTSHPIQDPTSTLIPTISEPKKSSTQLPTLVLSNDPTTVPTSSKTKLPIAQPTQDPTLFPTTSEPTKRPTRLPTIAPTFDSSNNPTSAPTSSPTKFPTSSPTKLPTSQPTPGPTLFPTTSEPIESPTLVPTNGINLD